MYLYVGKNKTHNGANIHFQDGTRIKKVQKATYLGCEIGIRSTSNSELNKRFANTMITMKKLNLFWRHSNCNTATKVHVAEAVLRAELSYGVESAQLQQ